jgi:hypothetical protein
VSLQSRPPFFCPSPSLRARNKKKLATTRKKKIGGSGKEEEKKLRAKGKQKENAKNNLALPPIDSSPRCTPKKTSPFF